MALFLSALAFHATVSAGGFSAPETAARLEAGRRIEVRWRSLPRDVEEMELLVSVDGGRTFARVADLEPSDDSYDWEVPSLPTERAVLAIRGRVHGRETLLFQTDAFAIEGAGRNLQPLSYHDGELWTDTAGGATPVTGMAGRERASGARSFTDEPAETSTGLQRREPTPSKNEPVAPADASAPAPESSRSRSPLAFPCRK
ncbi:MAG TPA: hypothetical protein VGR00_13090 [Thermoanaerobaculia bacterium]|nr:hypothetical protein [Thermoanaerobaculia bacterium]